MCAESIYSASPGVISAYIGVIFIVNGLLEDFALSIAPLGGLYDQQRLELTTAVRFLTHTANALQPCLLVQNHVG